MQPANPVPVARLRATWNWWVRQCSSVIGWFLGPWMEPASELPPGWTTDATIARLAQEPLRARKLLHVTLLVTLLLILWAALARLDEVTRGEAKVVPSRQIQVIQSLDGGIVCTRQQRPALKSDRNTRPRGACGAAG